MMPVRMAQEGHVPVMLREVLLVGSAVIGGILIHVTVEAPMLALLRRALLGRPERRPERRPGAATPSRLPL